MRWNILNSQGDIWTKGLLRISINSILATFAVLHCHLSWFPLALTSNARRRLPINSLCSSALTTAQALPLRQARQATMTVFLMNGCRIDEISASYRRPHGTKWCHTDQPEVRDASSRLCRSLRPQQLKNIRVTIHHDLIAARDCWMTRRLFQDDGDTTGHGVTHIVKIFGDQNRRAAPDVTTMVTALSATIRRRRYWKSVADPVLWAQRASALTERIDFNKLSVSWRGRRFRHHSQQQEQRRSNTS